MNVINLSVPAGVSSPVAECGAVMIGYVGEGGVTQVVLDFSAWAEAYGDGVITLGVQRSGDPAWYPVVLAVDGTSAAWLVSKLDTNVEGMGVARFAYTVGGAEKRSAVWQFFVDRGLQSPEGDAPGPYENWVDTLTELGAETLQNAQDAQDAAQAAEQSATDAAGSAESAETAKNAAGAAAAAALDSARAAGENASTAQGAAQAAQNAAGAAEQSASGAEAAQQAAETAATHYPQIINDYWWVWDVSTGAYVNTNVKAKGEGGEGAVSSVNGQTGAVTLDAEDVGALPEGTTLDQIPDGSTYKRPTAAQLQQISTNAAAIALKQAIINASGMLKGNGNGQVSAAVAGTDYQTPLTAGTDYATPAQVNAKYTKPAGGIPKTDLAAAVQTSLDKADSALQAVPNTYRTAAAQDVIDAAQNTAIAGKYTKPGTGIPENDLASDVQSKIDNALPKTGDGSNVTAAFSAAANRTNISTGEKLSVIFGKIAKWFSDLGSAAFRAATGNITQGSTDLVESGAVYNGLSEKYSKPTGGIPKTDLAAAVQTSLDKADSALQAVPNTYRTAAAQDVIDAGKLPATTKYASSKSVGGAADKTVSIPMGSVDLTSTATDFKATVDGITELRSGVLVWLTNGVVTSAAGCTLNINNLGARPIYNSIAEETATTTTFNANYTMLFIYNATRVEGGCWDMVYGYDSNTTYTPVKLGFGYATCTTAAATAAKVASLSSYSLVAGGLVAVTFSNDVPANATLNINSKGAKAIYYEGAAIKAGVINAGDTALFVYSTYYRLLSIDRWGTDIGKAYVKPTGGIPASDMTQAVQTSLGKADTALQAVPNTYRTAAAQDVIDAGKAAASSVPNAGNISSAGVISIKHDTTELFTMQLPLYNGGVSNGT